MNNSLLSLIVPVYNVEAYFCECLDSIEANTYPDIEILLVDDGSTDKSRAICDSYQQRDNRIRVIHQQNKGQSAARNAALNIAKGDYITFVDSDDMISPSTIEANMRILKDNPDIDILQYPITRSKHETDLKTRFELGDIRGGRLFELWLKDKQIKNYVCGKFFKRDMFNTLRFVEGMYYEDRYLMCDLLKACSRFYFSPYGQYFYRLHGSQCTQKAYSPQVLQSLIAADLHIYTTVASYKSLHDIALERYNNCLYYYRYAKSKNWAISPVLISQMRVAIPSVDFIMKSHAAWGIKIKCIALSILGINFMLRRAK